LHDVSFIDAAAALNAAYKRRAARTQRGKSLKLAPIARFDPRHVSLTKPDVTAQ
jgi:hypothetical protein